MADGVEVRTNLPEFKRQLSALGENMEKNIVRSAVNAAAQVFKKAVIADAAKRTGTLRQSIYVYRRRSPEPGTIKYSVSFRKGKKEQKRKGGSGDAFYGRFLELGWIPRGPGKRFAGGSRSKALQRKRAIAGGARRVSYPFLAPGFRSAKDAALAAFTAKMQERIAKANNER